METKLNIGILGYGEVGKAISSFYERPYVYDISSGQTFPDDISLDILHVCIPFNDAANFQATVKYAIMKWCKGGLVIIHSSVPVGTTEEIQEHHKMTVHSPVRGVHPNLAEGIRTFPKYVGGDNAIATATAAEHLRALGIPVVQVYRSRATELLKLLDTTYYGLAIAFHAYARNLCDQEGVPFEVVMTEGNRTYNEGYVKLGKGNVVRPVLFAPADGKIGGHCVIPNAKLLEQTYGGDVILDAILRHE
jgi:UDP-N-acetyl-D-mannosaminuronate dehydrogenase